jgi:hypothetical protein
MCARDDVEWPFRLRLSSRLAVYQNLCRQNSVAHLLFLIEALRNGAAGSRELTQLGVLKAVVAVAFAAAFVAAFVS